MPTEAPPLELKSTINLPKTKFAQKANLPQSEPSRLKKWADMKLYGRIQQARAGAKKFILHDGPPYANADIHLGTALNKILKDLIIKSRTMLGYDAPYVPGYDCHGLPIELHVERKLGEKKAKMPPLSIRRACREFAANTVEYSTRVPGIRGERLEATDARFSETGNLRGMGQSLHHDVGSLRGRNGPAVCAFRRTRLRLQRRTPGLLVHS